MVGGLRDGAAVNAQLALALLAVGPLKSSLAPATAPSRPDQPLSARPAETRVEDRIAGLAREWLRKR